MSKFWTRWSLFIYLLAIVGAFLFVQPLFADNRGRDDDRGDRHENDRGDRDGDDDQHDSRPIEVDLSRFTDVQAVLAAVSKAKTDAQALLTQNPRRDDREHIKKAVKSLDDALATGLVSRKLDRFFDEVRRAVQALDEVRGPRATAQGIARDLTEALRVATLAFIDKVGQGIPQITDTRARSKAVRRVDKAREDYARGMTAANAGRIGEAVEHFGHVFDRLLRVAAMIPQVSVPTRRFSWPYSGMIRNTGNIFLDIIDPSDNVLERIPVPVRPLVGVSPDKQFAIITSWVTGGDTTPTRLHNLRHVENGVIRSFEAMPFSNSYVTNKGATAIWGWWWFAPNAGLSRSPSGFQVFDGQGNLRDSESTTGVNLSMVFDSATSEFILLSDTRARLFDSQGINVWSETLGGIGGQIVRFDPSGDVWITFFPNPAIERPRRVSWWHWMAAADIIEIVPWETGPRP